MTDKKYSWAMAGLVLLSLTACSSTSSLPSSNNQHVLTREVQTLSNSRWQVESLNQAGIIDFSHVTFDFNSDDNTTTVSGSTGCNHYTGAFKIKEANKTLSEYRDVQSVSVEKVSLTKKMCAPALMKQEQSFVDALNATLSFAVIDDTWLVLYDSEENEVLRAVLTIPSSSRAGLSTHESGEKANKVETRIFEKQEVGYANEQKNTTTYSCETPSANTTDLQVINVNSNLVTLSLNNSHHIVRLTHSASGAKFTNNKGVVFWDKGDVATLSINSGFYHCNISTAK